MVVRRRALFVLPWFPKHGSRGSGLQDNPKPILRSSCLILVPDLKKQATEFIFDEIVCPRMLQLFPETPAAGFALQAVVGFL